MSPDVDHGGPDDVPETCDLFYPTTQEPVDHQGERALRIARDLEADVLLLDSGPVIARLDDAVWQLKVRCRSIGSR